MDRTSRIAWVADVWGITLDEAAGIAEQYQARGALLDEATDLLMVHVDAAHVSDVVRREVPHLEGRSLLALARDGQFDRIVEDLQTTFDISRIQP